jgi:asparagine synthase (glutamine-hydrolysing)
MGAIAAVAFPDAGSCRPAVEAMLAEVPHRGGTRQVVLHGRTAIGAAWFPEWRDAGVQVVDGVALAFSGTLDNVEELARTMGWGAGRRADSPTGFTGFLIEAYRQFGENLPSHLRGAYGVVISDGQQLMCFRDHLGHGTLFYRQAGQAFHVASEAKQMVAGSGISRVANLDVVERIFYQADDDDTMPAALKGVERVPKAAVLTSDGSGVRTRRYWDPAALLETARFSNAEIQERFDELMSQAARRMVAGVDAVSLSGGIDSPAVASYAAPVHLERAGMPLQAYTFVYPDHPNVDERRYAELVAGQLGLPHHTYVQRARPLDRLAEWMRLVDGPVYGMSLPHYEMQYRQARAVGARTVLSGEAAEYVIDRRDFLVAHLLTRRKPVALWRYLRDQRIRGTSPRVMARALLSPLVPMPLRARRWRRQPWNIPAWVDRHRANEALVDFLVPAGSLWRKVQLRPLRAATVNSEARTICEHVCGVRNRRPWTDVDLWEFFLSLPAEVKFPTDERKGLVRRLLRGRVPDVILDRRDKTLFTDALVADIDYPELERWLLVPPQPIPGVDYAHLADRLRSRALGAGEYRWALNLANAHAFLSTA